MGVSREELALADWQQPTHSQRHSMSPRYLQKTDIWQLMNCSMQRSVSCNSRCNNKGGREKKIVHIYLEIYCLMADKGTKML
jgi:hypothetical protein